MKSATRNIQQQFFIQLIPSTGVILQNMLRAEENVMWLLYRGSIHELGSNEYNNTRTKIEVLTTMTFLKRTLPRTATRPINS